MKCKIVNHSSNSLPQYATDSAAGLDICANLTSPIVLNPLQRELIPTGLFIELPKNHEAQIRPRSGIALKNGVTVLNAPGTIDADYRGEIKVLLINLSDKPFTIHSGDRIAQMVIHQCEHIEWKEVTEISETPRGEGGFGSSGIQ